jgi:hypothetical protein
MLSALGGVEVNSPLFGRLARGTDAFQYIKFCLRRGHLQLFVTKKSARLDSGSSCELIGAHTISIHLS